LVAHLGFFSILLDFRLQQLLKGFMSTYRSFRNSYSEEAIVDKVVSNYGKVYVVLTAFLQAKPYKRMPDISNFPPITTNIS